MLKTTISRIKKVCAIAFVPRLLRGELRYTPGKFEKFTYVVQRTAQKSTKCSNPKRIKSLKKKSPEDPQKYAVSTVCENSVKSEFADATLICNYKPKPVKDIPRNANEIPNPLYKERSACRCEKCNEDDDKIPCNIAIKGTPPLYEHVPACRCSDCRRVIADIFGDSGLTMKRKRTLPDLLSNIAHVHTKGDSGNSKLVSDSRIQPKAYNIPEEKPPEPKKVEVKEDKSLIKDLRTGPNSRTILMNQKGEEKTDSNVMYTNLYDVAPEENMSIPSNKQKDQKLIWADEYGNDYGENSLYCEPNVTNVPIDTETLKLYKSLMKKNTHYENTEAVKLDEKGIEKLKNMSKAKLMANTITRATISKNDEEKLRQKIEHIEETPVVEAEKSKIDGFNITPKVLTNEESAMNFTDNALDEVAKRCLSSRHKQVDEIILREMDKLGIPITPQKNEHIKSDIFNKTENKTSDLKQECDQGASMLGDKSTEKYISEYKNMQDVNKPDNPIRTPLLQSSLTPQHCEPCVASSVRESKRTGVQTTDADPSTILTKSTWKNHLDPKHVLTCNETCPISPKPLTDCDASNFEGTQAIYERNFVANQDNNHDQPMKENAEGCINANKKETSFKREPMEKDPMLEQEQSCQHTKENSALDDSLKQSIKAASTLLTAATNEDKSSVNEDHSVNPEQDKQLSDDKDNMEYENDEEDYEIDLGRLEYATEQLHATSEQLLATSEQLLATSDQLQETSEQLKAATEILQATGGKVEIDGTKAVLVTEPSFQHLNKTTEKLRGSGEKFESLTENLESTSEKLQDLCDNFEQMLLTQMARPVDDKTKVTDAQRVMPSLLPSVTTGAYDSNSQTPSPPAQTKHQDNMEYIDKNKIDSKKFEMDSQASSSELASLAQQGATINPIKNMTNDLSSMLGPLPQVNDKTKLSELMKIVKERNRLIDTSNYLNASNMQGKKKNVPPLSMPMQNTPVNVITPGYPEIKSPMNKGVPNVKKPKVKFSTCDLETLGLDHSPSNYNQETNDRYDIFDNNRYQGIAVIDLEPASELQDEIAMNLKTLGEVMRSNYEQRKIETLEAIMLARTHYRRHRPRLFRTKNFDPWAPIPSWPQPKQKKRPKLQCPKDGCKSFPPTRAENDPPCGLRPCDTFPTYPSRKFSTLDYIAILMADNDIIEVVENEDSPILSRTFYKTEWTKPKYINKPYIESRNNEDNLKIDSLFEKPTIPRKIPYNNNTNNFEPKAKKPDISQSSKKVAPQVLNLNLEQLLLPTMASVSYAIVRHYTTKKEDEDIFWRPRSKIPTKAELKNLKVDPSMNKQIGNSAKYLLLSFNSGGAKPEVKNTVNIKKSTSEPVKNVKSTEGETKTQKDFIVAT